MTDEKRAAVAFICGNKYRNFVATRLFDYNVSIQQTPYCENC